jgi:hypothetical protein
VISKVHVRKLLQIKRLQDSLYGRLSRRRRSQFVKPAAQSYMQAVSDKGDENFGFDPLLETIFDKEG